MHHGGVHESVHNFFSRHTSEWEDRYRTTGRNALRRYFTFKDVHCASEEEESDESMNAANKHETQKNVGWDRC